MSLRALTVVAFLVAPLLVSPSIARAGALPAGPLRLAPAHARPVVAVPASPTSSSEADAALGANLRFDVAPRRPITSPRLLLSVHFGTNQALALGGYNAAHDLRVGQLRFAYARGQRIERRLIRSVVAEAPDAPELQMIEAISTGAALGATVARNGYVLADVKLQSIHIYAGNETSQTRTLTAGVEVGWRMWLGHGAYLLSSLRYWPPVWDDVPTDGVAVEAIDGALLRHTREPADESGVLASVMLGWEIGR